MSIIISIIIIKLSILLIMFKKVDLNKKIKSDEVYPITYDLNSKMTSVTLNHKLKAEDNHKFPPGVVILKINKKKSIDKLYDIVNDMYDDLKIPVKNGVVAYIGEERDDQTYYVPGDDFHEYLKKMKKNGKKKLHIYAHLPTKKESVIDIINSLNISLNHKKYLNNLCVNLLKTYIKKEDYNKINDILDKSRLFFLKYSGYHGGHRLHIDNPRKRSGPVFIINLGFSIIDYIPFREIMNKEDNYKAYRFHIKPGEIFIMDGDSRYTYSHGVPPNIKNKDYLRYAMLFRVPNIYKTDKLCNLSKLHIKNFSKCYSNIEHLKL